MNPNDPNVAMVEAVAEELEAKLARIAELAKR